MANQVSVAVRNARADAVEATIGASAVLKIFSGAPPENVAAADSGTVLAVFNLPSDWMAAASGGAKAKSGTWQTTGTEAAGAGTNAGHYRIYESNGTTCHKQGACSGPTDEPLGDMILNNKNIAEGQEVTVSSFGWTEPNA